MRHLAFPPALLRLMMALILALPGAIGGVTPALAADRGRIEAFLNVTGFDVALDSIALSASSAPQMLGLEAADFGSEWQRLSREVFDTGAMRVIALDILEETLSDDNLNHAVEFYASDLGQRLVTAENASHMTKDDDSRSAKGAALIEEMGRSNPDRLELLRRMNRAIDSSNTSLRALQEIQVRFLMAASAAGVVELRLDPGELRAMLKENEGEMRQALEISATEGAALTYRDFSDAELLTYTKALEQPPMQRVYELLNAVQYEIMANRFEALALRMADLQPQQDI